MKLEIHAVSELKIRRSGRSFAVTVATTVAESSTFRMADAAAAVVTIHGIPASTATTLTFYGSDDGVEFRELVGKTVTLARTTDGTAFTGVSAAYSLPASGWRDRVLLAPSVVVPFVRVVSDAELGTGVFVFVCSKS